MYIISGKFYLENNNNHAVTPEIPYHVVTTRPEYIEGKIINKYRIDPSLRVFADVRFVKEI